jgi:hypothetical protein
MENMQLVGAVDHRLRLVIRNHATQRIGGVNRAALFVFDSHVKGGVIREAVGEERISPHLAGARHPLRNSDRLLPDRPRVGDLENFGRGVEKFVQVGEVNIRANVIRAEIVHGKKRREIDFSRHRFAGLHVERRLGRFPFEGCQQPAFARIYFETEPALAAVIPQIDVAPGKVCDGESGQDWLVGDVLQPLEFQLNLDLPPRRGGQEKKREELKAEFHGLLE